MSILMHKRWSAAAFSLFVLASCVFLVACRTSTQQRLEERTDGKRIVPGPALRARLAVMLEQDGLDIENYDIEVLYSSKRPEVIFYCTLKEELANATEPALGEFYASVGGMPRDVYLSLMKKDSQTAAPPRSRDLVRNRAAAIALAEKALEAEGLSVMGRKRTVKSTDTFWIVEYRLPEEETRPLTETRQPDTPAPEVITVAVSRKTANVQMFSK